MFFESFMLIFFGIIVFVFSIRTASVFKTLGFTRRHTSFYDEAAEPPNFLVFRQEVAPQIRKPGVILFRELEV